MNERVEKDCKLFSIVIPAFNEEKYIGQCLGSIDRLQKGKMSPEVIVVDNGSGDSTIKICQERGVRVLIKKEGTIGSLRNYGAKASTGEILIFLDADCIVPQSLLEKSVEYLGENDSAILGFRLIVPESSNWVAKCWDLLFVGRYSNGEPDWIPSGNMVMLRKTFLSIGGFNEELTSNEDVDFCNNARNRGFKIMSFDQISIIHLRPPDSLMRIFKKELWHGNDVLRVFLMDVYESKKINFMKAKNFWVIAFSFFYLICLLFLIFSSILAVNNTTPFIGIVALFCPIVVSFLLAIKYVKAARKYNLILGMTVLILIYGFSRGLGLLYKPIHQK